MPCKEFSDIEVVNFMLIGLLPIGERFNGEFCLTNLYDDKYSILEKIVRGIK